MAGDSKHSSLLVCIDDYEGLGGGWHVQVGNMIFLELGNERYLIDQCRKVEKYTINRTQKIQNHKLQKMSMGGPVVLWSNKNIKS